MARTLSVALAALASQQYGSEPITVVRIDWSTGTRYYSDKVFTFGSNICEPKILSLGTITSQQIQESASDVTSANISLDDTDNSIRTLASSSVLPGTICTVYQTYSTLGNTSDALIVLRGRIANDITYPEGQRTIGFNIDTSFQADELGFAPKKGDLANLSTDAEGRLWPIVFGSCLKVPAVQIYKRVAGNLQTNIASLTTTFTVENGIAFPQDTSITVKIGKELITGTMHENIFTITARNIATDTDIGIGPRVGGDLDPSVLWLSETANLEGKYCYINSNGIYINYCTSQVGNKCTFLKPWKINGNPSTVVFSSGLITEACYNVRSEWGDTFQLETITGAVNSTTVETPAPTSSITPPTTVLLYTNEQPTYVVAGHATTIKGVYAYRTYNSKRILQAIPSSWYTKNENTTIDGNVCATITFPYELEYRLGDWESDIYVTQTGLTNNTATTIKYILENYTSYSTDASFTSVAAKITRYPSNFAILEQSDILSLVADIAYQARLAIKYNGSVASISYLSETPVTTFGFVDDNMRSKSIEYGYTSLDDIVTKYTATWKSSYIDEKQKEYVYKNNNETYGTKEYTHDYFIYNIGSLVELSVNYHGNRVSSSWRTVRLSTFLAALPLEVFDCASVSTDTLAGSPLRGEVNISEHDTLEDVINLTLKLASKSGSVTEDMTFFTGGVTGTEPTPGDPTSGIVEIDYKPAVTLEGPNNNDQKDYIKFTVIPEDIVRGRVFNLYASIFNRDDTIKQIDRTFALAAVEQSDIDIVSPTSITFVNGQAALACTVTGGSTDTVIVFNIIGDSEHSTAVSEGIPITSEPSLAITSDHTSGERGSNFVVGITGGLPNTTYNVTLDSQDANEKLYSGSTEVTSITLDATGGASEVWQFRDGTFAINSVRIVLEHTGHYHYSPEFMVIETSNSANLVVESVVINSYPGDVVYNDGASWSMADPAHPDIATKTLGVIGKVMAGDLCYIVCRGLMCLPGLTPHTNYGLGSLSTLAPDVDPFVLRSYESDLCWVGGSLGVTIDNLTDIADVDATVTLADGMLLRYNGTLWTPILVTDVVTNTYLENIVSSPDASIGIASVSDQLELVVAAVSYAVMPEMSACSIICNPTDAAAQPQALAAPPVSGAVLMRFANELGFGLIHDESIADVDWSKIVNVPDVSIVGHTHTASGDVTGTVTGTLSIAANAVTTAKIANSNVTNAKLQYDYLTINGTNYALGSSVTITGTFINPMTDPGDMIIGGVNGDPIIFPVNTDANVKVITSHDSATQYEILTLDLLNDVIITNPLTSQALTYNGTNWVNSNILINPMTHVGDIIVGGAGGQATPLVVNGDPTFKVLFSGAGSTYWSLINIEDINNTNIINPLDNQVLTWDAANSKWINKAVGGSGSPLSNPMETLGDMIVADTDGVPKRLAVNATNTVMAVISESGSTSFVPLTLSLLDDTIILNPTEGQGLVYNAIDGTWINDDIFQNPMIAQYDMIIGGVDGAPERLSPNALSGNEPIDYKYLLSWNGVTEFSSIYLYHCADTLFPDFIPVGDVLTFVYTGPGPTDGKWMNRPPSKSDTICCPAEITAQGSANTDYTLRVYPHGRPAEGGDITWSSVPSKILQIGASSPKVPIGTWVIVCGTKKIPNTTVGDHADYNWYIQPPVWM
jgi:hypothetical protein